MPRKYTLSQKADQEIESILEYGYRTFGLQQALKYKSGLEHCFQLLADMPDMGRKCDELRQGYRRHEHARHIIFYRKRESDILIVRILPGSMDVEAQFQALSI